MNEQDLIQGLVSKDEEAFRWLVNHYRDRVFATVLHLLQDRAEAEDAAQETFINVYQSVASFKRDASFSTWIYRIAVHKALDKLRRKKLRQKLQQWLPGWMPSEKDSSQNEYWHPGILLDQKDRAAILFKAIRALPQKQCLAFTLIKVQGMSYEEASAVLGQTIKALESLISRAKANLQRELEHIHPKK